MPPLAGVRAVEFEALGPVPYAGMMLADLGADIVRISGGAATVSLRSFQETKSIEFLSCYDNASMESFLHTLKVQLVHQRRWATRKDAKRDLFACIEGYYNRRRIHSALGYRTPEQAERHMA